MFITKHYVTIKHLPLNLLNFLFLLIDFCGHGCTNGRFAIFLWIWETIKNKKKPRKGRIHLRRKKVWTPFISKLYILFTFVCFEWFKELWVCHLKYFFGSVETMKQWTKSLNSKTQIILMRLNQALIPFTSKGHILLIMRPILTIFVALDMLGGGLQNLLKL